MKNRIILLLSLTLFIGTVNSYAQDYNDDPPFIEVIGRADQEVTPDMIFISVTLVEETVGKSRLTIAQQESNFLEIVNQLNIDPKKVVLTESLTQIIRRKQRDKGTKIAKTYMVEVNSAAQVSKFFELLTVNGIREATIERTNHSDIINIRKNVRIAAIKAAKEKAQYLTAAIGQELGMPLVIRAQVSSDFANALSGSNTALSTVTQNMIMGYDAITVSFSYYIKYQIN